MHDPVPLSPEPVPRVKPALPGQVVMRETEDEVIDALLADLFLHACNCVRAFGDFHLAVSATRESEPALRRLMYDPGLRDFPWKRTHLWIADDALVSADDERSRSRLVMELVVGQSDIPANQFHPMRTDEGGAEEYEGLLKETLGWREKGHDRPDFMLLTLGAGGSVGGLTAGSRAARERDRFVVTDGDVMTLTLPMINAARFVAVLATGEAGRASVAELAARACDMPARMVRPLGGELRWYLAQAMIVGGAPGVAGV